MVESPNRVRRDQRTGESRRERNAAPNVKNVANVKKMREIPSLSISSKNHWIIRKNAADTIVGQMKFSKAYEFAPLLASPFFSFGTTEDDMGTVTGCRTAFASPVEGAVIGRPDSLSDPLFALASPFFCAPVLRRERSIGAPVRLFLLAILVCLLVRSGHYEPTGVRTPHQSRHRLQGNLDTRPNT